MNALTVDIADMFSRKVGLWVGSVSYTVGSVISAASYHIGYVCVSGLKVF